MAYFHSLHFLEDPHDPLKAAQLHHPIVYHRDGLINVLAQLN